MRAPSDDELDLDRRPDDAFEELWLRVEGHWDDDKVHAAFLEYARMRTLLPLAAARYRQVKDHDLERAAKAQKQLDRIMALALTLLSVEREAPPSDPARRLRQFLIALSVLSFASLMLRMIRGC